MFGYIIRRVAIMPPDPDHDLVALAFMVVELPEGDMASAYVSRLERMGEEFRGDATEMLEGLRLRFGYGQPLARALPEVGARFPARKLGSLFLLGPAGAGGGPGPDPD